MASLPPCSIIIFLIGIVISKELAYAVVKETAIPEICNGRIEATHGGKVINIFWTGCNSPDCKTTFVAVFQNGGLFTISKGHASQKYHPFVTPGNTWQVECFYDKSLDDDSGNTPCKYQESKLKEKVEDIKTFKLLHVSISTCINQTCSGIKEYKFINPARNPCYFNNPCKNNGMCNPGVDTYNCTCNSQWVGTNCTVSMPQGYNYTAGNCLDYDAKIQEVLVSSAKECGSRCAAMNGTSKTICKSFEIKNVPSSDQKKCILRDSNRLTHRLVKCDGDYFESAAFNSRPKPTGASSSTGTSYFLLLIYIAWFTLK